MKKKLVYSILLSAMLLLSITASVYADATPYYNTSETTSQTDEIKQGKGPSCGNKKEAV